MQRFLHGREGSLAGKRLLWAEAHGQDPTVTVLRTLEPDEPTSVERLGRDTGLTTAIVAGDDVVFWATEDGIARWTNAKPSGTPPEPQPTGPSAFSSEIS